MTIVPEINKGVGTIKRKKWRTLFALAFGYFIDQGEGQVMSVFTPILKSIWGLTNTNIGLIGFIRSLLQALSSPFWGYASDKFSRRKVLLWGTGIWGIWTAVCGLTQNFGQLIAIRAISGVGLGCLMPATFSIMADTFPPKQRGKTLGILEAVGVLGIIIGTLGLGFLATESLWRWGFIILGLSSIISGLMIWFLVDEPVRGEAEPELKGKITEKDATKYMAKFSDIKKVLKIPTIWVAIGQGLSGSMPWVVMGLFMILWLVEERGLSTQLSTIVFATIIVGTAISNVLGGILGDYAESKNPKYGRTLIGQISIISGIPLTYILFTRTDDWPLWGLIVLCFFTALLISWPGKGSKEPMMQGVVAPELRSTAFSVTMFIESGFAAIAALVVGKLADNIGLTKAMIWMVPVPWILCALLFSLFYWTYPKDSKKLRDEMAQRSKEIDLAHQKLAE